MARESYQQQAARMRRRDARYRSEGRCVRCSLPMEAGGPTCLKCLQSARLHGRKVRGCQPWRPGGPGRPPKVRDEKMEAAQKAERIRRACRDLGAWAEGKEG